ncbi:MAG: PTS sugar transporter subunit IIA [Candidatus Omnitrophota bacterium]
MMERNALQLVSLLKEKYINLILKGHNKKKLLEELVSFVAQSGKIKDKKAILREIVKREKLGSTGIGYGVAIPHAKAQKAHGFVLVLGRHDEGIDFGALDGAKTHLFFMLVSPKEEVGNHLKILAEISRLVKDKFIVERLKKARDKKEILRIISAYQS